MGTRQLQKAQLAQADQLLERSGASESSSDDGDGGGDVAFNPFAFLGDDDAQAEEEAEEVNEEAEDVRLQSSPPAQSKPVGQQQRAKRKNKKKRLPATDPAQNSRKDSTDVDAAIQELGITLDSGNAQAAEQQAAAEQASQTTVLALQPKMLNPDEELRVMFGSAVMALEQSERQQGRQQGRNPQARPRGYKQTQRPKLLSRPANLPPADGLLSMQCLGANGGDRTQFQMTASAAYRTATMHFKQAQTSMDPNNIGAVLAAHPFHIQCLLAMCDLYITTGQAEYAGAMLNRALFALESAWHVHFKAAMLASTAWLPHDEGMNSLMFAALQRRVRSLGRQGVHRTALEWAKLTLGLDTDDPTGQLFNIDYYCLRAREYTYIPHLVRSFKGATVLSMVPSYAFSSALAAYYQSKANATSNPDTATGVHEPGSQPELDAKLITAICSFPAALSELIKALKEKGAATSAGWQAVMAMPMFSSPPGTDSATLMHLSRIFAARHDALWRAPDALAWLLRCAESSAALAEDPLASQETVHESVPAFEDMQALTAMTYPPGDENSFQHVSLAQFSESTAVQLPPDQLQDAGMGPGNTLHRQQAEEIVGGLMAGTGANELSDDELQGANPIMALLQTLLPWVNVSGRRREDTSAQRTSEVLAQIPGLEGYLEQHGVQLGAQVSQEDRMRLVELVHQYITQLQEQQ